MRLAGRVGKGTLCDCTSYLWIEGPCPAAAKFNNLNLTISLHESHLPVFSFNFEESKEMACASRNESQGEHELLPRELNQSEHRSKTCMYPSGVIAYTKGKPKKHTNRVI